MLEFCTGPLTSTSASNTKRSFYQVDSYETISSFSRNQGASDNVLVQLLTSLITALPSVTNSFDSDIESPQNAVSVSRYKAASAFGEPSLALETHRARIFSGNGLSRRHVAVYPDDIPPNLNAASIKLISSSPWRISESFPLLKRRGSSDTSNGQGEMSALNWLEDDTSSTSSTHSSHVHIPNVSFPSPPRKSASFPPPTPRNMSPQSSIARSRSRSRSPSLQRSRSDLSFTPETKSTVIHRRPAKRGAPAPKSKKSTTKSAAGRRKQVEEATESRLDQWSFQTKQQEPTSRPKRLTLTPERRSAIAKHAVAVRNSRYSREQRVAWGLRGQQKRHDMLQRMSPEERATVLRKGSQVTNTRYTREERSKWTERGKQIKRQLNDLQLQQGEQPKQAKQPRQRRYHQPLYKTELANRARKGALATNSRYSYEQRSQWAKEGALKRWRKSNELQQQQSPAQKR